MKLHSRGHEHLGNLLMKRQGGIHNVGAHLSHQEGKLVASRIQMIRKNRVVDGEKGIMSRKTHSKGGEMALQSGIDGEASGGWIHARQVLAIVNVLQRQLVSIVPMVVVQMLSNESVRLHRSVGVHLRHVHVVQEIDHLLATGWTIVLSSLLLQRLLQDLLQHLRSVVVVERNVGNQVVLIHLSKFFIHQDGFPTT